MQYEIAYILKNPDEKAIAKLKLLSVPYIQSIGYVLTEEMKIRFENEQVIPTLPSNIIITDNGKTWKISGDTYSKRGIFNSLSAIWNSGQKSWYILKTKASYDDLVKLLS